MSNKFLLSVAFHQGKTIIDIAKTYPNLLRTLLEVVQNSIDKGATRIEVGVNVGKGKYTVCDNGGGCGREEFQKALHSLNATMKAADKYGQFGRGLVAPLSTADRFEFTSCPSPRREGYCCYTFDAKEIIKQRDVEIPGEELTNLYFDPNGQTWWRTRVEVDKLTKDRRLTTLTIQSLLAEIGLKFGDAIRERSILVSVNVTDADGERKSENVIAPEFSGKKLQVIDKVYTDAGRVLIELYLSPLGRKGRRGTIVLGTTSNPSRISMKEFIENSRGLLDGGVAQCLVSGLFEGKILCEKTKLDPDRTRFEDNDALVELCTVLEKWYKDHGKAIVDEIRDQDSDDRFKRMAKSVMPFAELLIKQMPFQAILDAIKLGTIGGGHVKVPRKNIVGPDSGRSIIVNRPSEGGGGSGGGPGGRTTPPTKEQEKHHPGTLYTDTGKVRTEVKGGSTGLRFEFVEMKNINIPFEFNPDTGCLSFNINHPNWSACQERDESLIEYQREVVSLALSLELYVRERGLSPDRTEFTYHVLEQRVFAIKHGEAMLDKEALKKK